MNEIKHTASSFAHRFELHHAGECVSSLILFDYQLTYDSVAVKMGGIAGVQTHPEHRNKGYASELMKATVAWLANEQYPCSFLFGIPDFYWRYGYATLLTHANTEVVLRDVEDVKAPNFRTRPYEEKDLEAIRQLFNKNSQGGRMCSILRDENWRGIPRGSDWPIKATCLVVESLAGEIEGYVVFDADDPEVIVSEVETRNPAAQYAVLEVLVKRGITNRQKEFRYLGPTSHPFAVFLRRFGAEHNDLVERFGFGMGRLTHLESFFQQIAPELSRRSWLLPEDTQCVFTFQTDIGQCSLNISRGCVQLGELKSPNQVHVACKQLELTRLVFGVVDYQTFSVSPETKIQGEAGTILTTLFPTRLSTIPPTSWF